MKLPLNKSARLMLLATSTLCAGFGASSAAFAQQADAVVDQTDIIVTARRTEERLQDVPISITVFNQDQLDQHNVVNAQDLAAFTPSLAVDNRFGSDNASFAIRGFTQELRTTQTVATYFADVVTPRSGSSLIDGAGAGAYFDLQNVQVLKGPQGTLFGRNTTGGAVLLVPQRPTDEFGGYIEGALGDYNMERLQGVVNVPISDNLRVRFGVDAQQRDGTQHIMDSSDLHPDDFNDVNYYTGRASLVWDITSNLENYTILSYTNSDTHPGVSQVFACNNNDPTQIPAGQCDAQLAQQSNIHDTAENSTLNPRNRTELAQIINTTTWNVSDNLTIKNILSYAHNEAHTTSAVFGTNFTDPEGLPYYYSNSMERPGYPSSSQNTLVEEVQFQGNAFDNKLVWQTGLYYEHSEPDGVSGGRSVFATSCDLSTLGGDPDDFRCADNFLILGFARAGGVGDSETTIEYENKAAYFQASYDLTDQLTVTGGIRYTWDETEGYAKSTIYGFRSSATYGTDYGHYVVNSGIFPPVVSAIIGETRCVSPVDTYPTCSSTASQESEAPTWMLGLDYQLTDDNMVYAKYARGYRQGSVIPYGLGGFNTFGPEEVDSYEIGSKNTFRGPFPGVLNASIFYNDFRQQQLQLGLFPKSGVGTTAIYNANSSTIWGIELDGSVELFEGFRLSGGYTYLHTNVDSLAFPGTTSAYCTSGAELACFIFGGAPNAALDQPLPNSPQNKATITASYTLPTPETVGEVTISATYNVTSHYQTCAISESSPYCGIPGYETINLNLDWNHIGGSNVDGAVFVTNVTDQEYTTFVSGTYGTGFETRTVGDPMMAGVRVRYHFGADS